MSASAYVGVPSASKPISITNTGTTAFTVTSFSISPSQFQLNYGYAPITLPPGGATVVRGAGAVARQTMVLGPRARFAAPALVNGTVGVVVAPHGRLRLVLALTVRDGLIAGYDVIADPVRLGQLDLAVLGRDT